LDKIYIQGGSRLEGEVRISGSKNATLAIMAGAALVDGKVTLHNIPRIGDTHTMVELLNGLGAATRFVGDNSVVIDSAGIYGLEAPYELVRKMRASFCVLGPLVARFGFARVPVPGGCDIGARPVNFHIEGLRRLGARIDVEHGVYTAECRKLQGANVYLDFQSAGATQHLMTAACLAEGTTVIENCAAEPEVVDLANFLNALGGKVEGAGTPTITVEGVERLHEGEYRVISDRMEAGTFAVAAAVTEGDIYLRGAVPDHMRPVTNKLEEAGVGVSEDSGGMRFRGPMGIHPISIKTAPHPGFPTDMQQPFAAMLAIAKGTSTITETVYESRFRYVNELSRMGALVKVEGRTAIIEGVQKLTGAPVTSTDLRAGATLICAGLAAEGESEISGVEHVDRGYDGVVDKLRAIGAKISRGIEDPVPGGLKVCSL
jgi:UDP-N-acetylglucosamine 1-carboxyvinyltransferase